MQVLNIIIGVGIQLALLTAIGFKSSQELTLIQESSDYLARSYTVKDRVKQFGEQVRERWKPYFENAGVSYPGKAFTFIGLKEEARLEVWVDDEDGKKHFLRSFPILAASGDQGPKLQQGDYQVPEGDYRISFLNPNSRFHLSLRVNYPNAADRAQAKRDGRKNLGGDIMIHGNAVSIGCLAMGDEAAEDLFILAAKIGLPRNRVLLLPYDLRVHGIREDASPAWVKDRYEALQEVLKSFHHDQE